MTGKQYSAVFSAAVAAFKRFCVYGSCMLKYAPSRRSLEAMNIVISLSIEATIIDSSVSFFGVRRE